MPRTPVQQVLDVYIKDLSMLENELEKLINQQDSAQKRKGEAGVQKQLKTLTEKISDTKREIFKKKHQYKLAAAEQEKDNRKYLIAIQSDNGWYKFAHYSVCFFATDIQPRLKNPGRFHLYPDTDNYGYSPYGVISVRLDEDFINELKLFKITEEKSEVEGLRFFRLPWIYTEKRFEKIISEIERNQEKIDAIVLPKLINPQLFKQIEDLNIAAYYAARGIKESLLKETLGRTLFSHTTNLTLNYLKVSNSMSIKSYETIIEELNYIGYVLKTLLDLQAIKYHDGLRIGGLIVKVRNIMKGFINGKN